MRRLFAGLALATSLTSSAAAAPAVAWPTWLKQDQVQVAGGRYTWQERQVCTLPGGGPGATRHLEWSAEGDASQLSRDTFVRLNGALNLALWVQVANMHGLRAQTFFDEARCEIQAGPDEKVDFRIHLTHGAGGVEVAITEAASGKVERNQAPWSAVLGQFGPKPGETPAPEGDPYEIGVRLMEEMADLTDRHKDDCEQMGKQLEAFFDRNQADMKRLKSIGNPETDPKAAASQAKYMDRIAAALQRQMPGQLACQDSPALEAAMKKF